MRALSLAAVAVLGLALTRCSGARARSEALPQTRPVALSDAAHADAALSDAASADAVSADAVGEGDGGAGGESASEGEGEERRCAPGVEPRDPTDEQLAEAEREGDAEEELTEESEGDGRSPLLDAWILTRVRRARAGSPERVRVLLTLRGSGWGCMCPSHFVGGTPDGHTGGVQNWLDVAWRARAPEPRPRVVTQRFEGETFQESRGWQRWVEGRFTGERTTEDLRNECGEPEAYFYRPWIFEVLSVPRERAPEGVLGRVVPSGARSPSPPSPSAPRR